MFFTVLAFNPVPCTKNGNTLGCRSKGSTKTLQMFPLHGPCRHLLPSTFTKWHSWLLLIHSLPFSERSSSMSSLKRLPTTTTPPHYPLRTQFCNSAFYSSTNKIRLLKEPGSEWGKLKVIYPLLLLLLQICSFHMSFPVSR